MNLYSSIFKSFNESERYFIKILLRKKPNDYSNEEFLERCFVKLLALKTVFYAKSTTEQAKIDEFIQSINTNYLNSDSKENPFVRIQELNDERAMLDMFNISISSKETKEIDPDDDFDCFINYPSVLNMLNQINKQLNPQTAIPTVSKDKPTIDLDKIVN